MRARVALLTFAFVATVRGLAAAQSPAGDPLDLPPNATMSGLGVISASPMQPNVDQTHVGKRALPTRSTRLPARLLGNGTAMNYGESGANAVGNTGGLTTGPAGSAGAIAGGGGVHSGALVIPPGPTNAQKRSDDTREHLPVTIQPATNQ